MTHFVVKMHHVLILYMMFIKFSASTVKLFDTLLWSAVVLEVEIVRYLSVKLLLWITVKYSSSLYVKITLFSLNGLNFSLL